MPDVDRETTTAWTPGPWGIAAADEDGHTPVVTVATPLDGCSVIVAMVQGIDSFNWPGIGDDIANAQLIALAPEMAEAILAWRDDWDRTALGYSRVHGTSPNVEPSDDVDMAIYSLATKLRAIGGSDA